MRYGKYGITIKRYTKITFTKIHDNIFRDREIQIRGAHISRCTRVIGPLR